MRKLVTENITVDGVIDASGGWFDPAADAADNSMSTGCSSIRPCSAAAPASSPTPRQCQS
jgi:hypothetical protein